MPICIVYVLAAIVLEDNSHYKKMIKDRAMPKVEFFELEMEDGMSRHIFCFVFL